MPEDGMRRWLVHGELREEPMTYRNRWHSRTEARIAQLLNNWNDNQPVPRGAVCSGEAGFRLQRDPDTVVGIDVAYIDATLSAAEPDDTTLIDGVPTLAVEILSPSTTIESLEEKLSLYQLARVPLVWVVNPYRRTVTIHRPDEEPIMVNATQTLDGHAILPNFTVPVSRLFER
jgi:Uma2 family endonuclease